MGLFSGAISVTKFHVRGDLPKRYLQAFLGRLEQLRFSELDPEQDDEERSGWCVASAPLDLALRHEQVVFGEYLIFGLRIDRWRFPRPLLRAQLDQALAAWREKTGREKISKKDKDDLRARVERKLRKKLIPSLRHFDVCFDPDRRTVRLWSRSPRVKEEFRVLFERTFNLELDEDSPYVAARRALSESEFEPLTELEPSLPLFTREVSS